MGGFWKAGITTTSYVLTGIGSTTIGLKADSVTGIDFANSRQTLPEIKERDTGLFGKLPPDLQRAGRDIFNTAKNQVPIGKLFKGKLFPPFT